MKKSLQYFLSFFLDVTIEDVHSAVNPKLKIVLRNGKHILNATRANYSYDGLHRVFRIVFEKILIKKSNPKSVLILGFGAGSVATILQKELQIQCSITGVEADEEVIKLSAKYFPNQFSNTSVIIQKAEDYINNCNTLFDLIVVDVFVDLQVPQEIQQKYFFEKVSQLINDNGIVVYNFVLHSKEARKQFEILREHCNFIFPKIEILRVLNFNRVLVMKK